MNCQINRGNVNILTLMAVGEVLEKLLFISLWFVILVLMTWSLSVLLGLVTVR